MIKLDSQHTKTTTSALGNAVTVTLLDTVWVDRIDVDRTGNINVTIRFGIKNKAGQLVETDTPVIATVQPDGSFVSNDPKYQGQLDAPTVQQMLTAIFQQFESAMISFGWTAGTVE